jgi:head-tail adaptor
MPVYGPKTLATLQSLTATVDAVGSFTETWSTVQTVYGVLQDVTAKEKIAYAREITDQLYHFYIAYEEFSSVANTRSLSAKSRFAIGMTDAVSYTASTIAFVEGTTVADTITDSVSGFLTAGITGNMAFAVTGSPLNSKIFEVAKAVAGTLTLRPSYDLAVEAQGVAITLSQVQLFNIVSVELKGDAKGVAHHYEVLLEVIK